MHARFVRVLSSFVMVGALVLGVAAPRAQACGEYGVSEEARAMQQAVRAHFSEGAYVSLVQLDRALEEGDRVARGQVIVIEHEARQLYVVTLRRGDDGWRLIRAVPYPSRA
ncbi:hypothetical protein [Sandaracinus amylolyticus]|uniref:Uncharacterized protein n=1 Tax=Sandaracinus amylolyticus TaxID=927083 RepID=A0A0F6W071_9BACT|nr:hypothetical protein [Sandaracinus amylolyticus]AKF04125.1 hypothetical protein DB32_001274 [Sandaracinus amylolyticus]